MSERIWLYTRVARLDGVVGTEVICRQHGRVAWVRTSEVDGVVATHVRKKHVLTMSGLGSRTIGTPEPVVLE